MQAYLNNIKLKEKVIAGLKAHYEANEIIQGIYWENGKGCAISYILYDLDPALSPSLLVRFENELGIPEIIARLIDTILDGLIPKKSEEFSLQIMNTIQAGAELNLIWPKFLVWMLSEILIFIKYPDVIKSIETIINLYKRLLSDEIISQAEWMTAFRSSSAVAYATHDSELEAAYAAADIAYGNAYDSYCVSETAVIHAANAYIFHNKEVDFYEKMANKLIELLKE